MSKGLRAVGVIGGIASFALCLTAGIWMLVNAGFQGGEEAVWTALGLYFTGKAFFVGPMLILAACQDRTCIPQRPAEDPA